MLTINLTAAITSEIADLVSAFIFVYTLCILAWIVVSIVLSLGVQIPYARWSSAILDFLRDVCEPFLGIFRKLGLQFGPLDFSPMVALIVLTIGGKLVVELINSL